MEISRADCLVVEHIEHALHTTLTARRRCRCRETNERTNAILGKRFACQILLTNLGGIYTMDGLVFMHKIFISQCLSSIPCVTQEMVILCCVLVICMGTYFGYNTIQLLLYEKHNISIFSRNLCKWYLYYIKISS